MADPETTRLETELALLDAMYPDQTSFNHQSRELGYSDGAATLCLRLLTDYPDAGFPDVILATDATKTDLRAETSKCVKDLHLPHGEEALDAILAAFQQVISRSHAQHAARVCDPKSNRDVPQQFKTVIIWLHHLLNTNKRKLALSPASSSPPVCGLTKPGYPGVLVFSGPASAVTEHVNTLKAQNWQAFQVRYEEEVEWKFTHESGIKEVESMSEMVKGIGDFPKAKEGAERQKQEFLKAVGIK